MEIRSRVLSLMLAPAAALLLFFVFPMVIMGLFSFRLGSFGAEREIFTLQHYQDFIANSAYQQLFGRSILIAFETSILSILLAYPVAYYLVFSIKKSRLILLTIILAPAWTSFLLRILAWKLVLGSGGLLSHLLLALGIIQEQAPVLLYTRAAVIITLVYTSIPFVALPIFASLERIDYRLLEAAADLGATPLKTFLSVTLPLSMPGIVAGFFFVFIPTLGEWITPALVGGVAGTMYGNIIQDQFVNALNWPMGSLMSLVMLIVSLLLAFIFSRIVPLFYLGSV